MTKKIIFVVVIALPALVSWLYYTRVKDNQNKQEQSSTDKGPEVFDYRDYAGDPSERRNNLTSIDDTVYLWCRKDCNGYSDGYAMGYSLYGQLILTDYGDYDYDRINAANLDEANGEFRIMEAPTCYFLTSAYVKCFGRNDTFNPALSYVYIENRVAVVGTEEFMLYYLPVFGKSNVYGAIPASYKRSIVDYMKKNDLISTYYLSPNPLRAENVVAYGNFAHVGNNSTDAKFDGMVVVLDEKNGQASRLVVFARTSTKAKFIVYDEHFDFPVTLQKITSYDEIYSNTEERANAEGDGILIRFSNTLSRVLYFEDKLQRFVWYDQKPKSELEETDEDDSDYNESAE